MKQATVVAIVQLILLAPVASHAGDSTCLSSDCHEVAFTTHSRDRSNFLSQCLDCHPQQSGDHGTALATRATPTFDQSVCLKCHGRLTAELHDPPNIHPPVKKGPCSVCHLVHFAPEASPFRGNYPRTFREKYSTAKYSLCWECHDPLLAETQYTSTWTRFRNGERNLHYLHVHALGGIPCGRCHQKIHASKNLAFVEPKWVDMSQMIAGVADYKANLNGGTCLPTCHIQMSYDRTTPGK